MVAEPNQPVAEVAPIFPDELSTYLSGADNSLQTSNTMTDDDEVSSFHSDTSTIVDVVMLMKAYDEEKPPLEEENETSKDSVTKENNDGLICTMPSFRCLKTVDVVPSPVRRPSAAVNAHSIQQHVIDCYIYSMEQDDAQTLERVAQFEKQYYERQREEERIDCASKALPQWRPPERADELVDVEDFDGDSSDEAYLEHRTYQYDEWTPWEVPAVAPRQMQYKLP
uniref:Uncharacterized protein n=1 Tax=Parascaris univalens TaxID=6257 RepID=A0A914ZWM7_PARUN